MNNGRFFFWCVYLSAQSRYVSLRMSDNRRCCVTIRRWSKNGGKPERARSEICSDDVSSTGESMILFPWLLIYWLRFRIVLNAMCDSRPLYFLPLVSSILRNFYLLCVNIKILINFEIFIFFSFLSLKYPFLNAYTVIHFSSYS